MGRGYQHYHVDATLVYVGYPKESRIKEFSKISGYKIKTYFYILAVTI